MTDYIDLLLEEQLERQEREEGDGTWNGDAVQVPLPQQEERAPQAEQTAEKKRHEAPVWPEAYESAAGEPSAARAGAQTQELGEREPRPDDSGVGEEAGRVRYDGEAWTVRRWMAGQTAVNQAGPGMDPVQQMAGESARTYSPDIRVHRAEETPECPVFDYLKHYPSDLAGAAAGLEKTADLEQVGVTREEGVLAAGWAPLRQMAGMAVSADGSKNTGAGWLDRAVRVSLEGLPAPDRESKVVTLEPAEWNGGGGRLELRQLDRLIRRDARRFDGGFQLL